MCTYDFGHWQHMINALFLFGDNIPRACGNILKAHIRRGFSKKTFPLLLLRNGASFFVAQAYLFFSVEAMYCLTGLSS